MSASPNPNLGAGFEELLASLESSTQISTPDPFADVPQRMQDSPTWVVWKYVVKKGKKTKPPFDANTSGASLASTTDPDTWADFETAVDVAGLEGIEGPGIVLKENFQGADLDGAVQTINSRLVINPFALAIAKLANTYCEYSPSRTGLHLVWESHIPLPEGNRNGNHDLGGEIYDKDSPRYLTVTGDKVPGVSTDTITNITDPNRIKLIHFLVLNTTNEKLTSLWVGAWQNVKNAKGTQRYPSQSEADMALCSLLVSGGFNSVETLDAAFRCSGLMREDWDRTSKYTIAKAIKGKGAETIAEPAAALDFALPAVTTGTNYDFVIEPDPGQTDGWFPLGSPSLIGGASGSTKSTWMMHLLVTQEKRGTVLGHQTFGRPYLVLMADRGEASHARTMRRMRMETENIQIEFLSMQMGPAALQEIVQKIEAVSPLPQVVFIEGCDMLVEDANKKHIVGPFMSTLQKIATHYHLAIIGSVGAPKCKAGEGYVAKRDNISGTEAWSRLAETVVLLQYPKGKDTALERELTVLPRNAPAESFALIMKQGRLELQTEEDRRRAEGQDREILWVQARAELAKSDPTKEWWTVLDLQRELSLTKSTAYRWAEHAHAKHYVVEQPGGQGRRKAALYKWNDSKTNPLWIESSPEQTEIEL